MGEITDLIFSILGKIGRIFNVQGKKVCFIIWGICLIYWTIRNFKMDLWVQTGSCILSFCMHVYGFFNWKHKEIFKK